MKKESAMAQTSRALVVQSTTSSRDDVMRSRRLRKTLIEELLNASRLLIEARRDEVVGWYRHEFALVFDTELGGGILTEEETATEIRKWTVINYPRRMVFVTYGLDKNGHWLIIFRKS